MHTMEITCSLLAGLDTSTYNFKN